MTPWFRFLMTLGYVENIRKIDLAYAHRRKPMINSTELTGLFNRNPEESWRILINTEEKLIHYCTPEAKQQAKYSVSLDNLAPKKVTEFNLPGLLSKWQVNQRRYYANLLDQLRDDLKQKTTTLGQEERNLHFIKEIFYALNCKFLPPPLYSRDLAPSNLTILFFNLQKRDFAPTMETATLKQTHILKYSTYLSIWMGSKNWRNIERRVWSLKETTLRN